jgi:4-hydroxy-tetrahydrodipicolinate synthase
LARPTHTQPPRKQQQGALGLAVRKYVLMRRGVLASDAQRKPGLTLTPQAKAEVDYLLSRVARFDRRAMIDQSGSPSLTNGTA